MPLEGREMGIKLWLKNLWHARQRKVDMEILWPACLANAVDLDHARAAFAVHALQDEAWTTLGHEAVCRMIDNLPDYGLFSSNIRTFID
jgi:hypothetical protein